MKTKAKNNAMSTAGFVMGLLALITGPLMFATPLFAGLGICFSILSRGDGKTSGLAKLGVLFSILGIVLGVVVGHLVSMHFSGLFLDMFDRYFYWTTPFAFPEHIEHHLGHLARFISIFESIG